LFQRHGAFVWDRMPADDTKKFINQYSVISAEEGIRRQEVMEADRLANIAANLLEDSTYVEPSQAELDTKFENGTCTKKVPSRKASVSNSETV